MALSVGQTLTRCGRRCTRIGAASRMGETRRFLVNWKRFEATKSLSSLLQRPSKRWSAPYSPNRAWCWICANASHKRSNKSLERYARRVPNSIRCPGLALSLEEFVTDHRPHGALTGDVTEPDGNGYLIMI